MKIFIIFITCYLMGLITSGETHYVQIGAIFHTEEVSNYKAFQKALSVLEREQIAPSFRLKPIYKWINTTTNSFETYLAVNDLVEAGVAAIFGPGDEISSSIVNSITEKYQIPHIQYIPQKIDDIELPRTAVNLYPDTAQISAALIDFLKTTNWERFTVLYESEDSLSRLRGILTEHASKDTPVTIRNLKSIRDPVSGKFDYRPALKEIAASTDFHIILDVDSMNLEEVITQANEFHLLGDYFNYIITCLHSPTEVMLDLLGDSIANVTVMQALNNRTIKDYDLNTLESAYLFDGVFLLYNALEMQKKFAENHASETEQGLYHTSHCDDVGYSDGIRLSCFMKKVTTMGRVSGPITFGDDGKRSLKLRFREFRGESTYESGFWENGELTVTRTQEEREKQSLQSIEQRTFRVTTKWGPPYVQDAEEGSPKAETINNKQYEGYAIDLIRALAEILKFRYEFEMVKDIGYGKEDVNTKQWDGLIGRLLTRKADLAICDFTITEAREKAVDFTTPFMDLGISILFAKPDDKKPDLFSFLSPFSTDIWIYMATAYVAVSILIFVQARIVPEEWISSHPCQLEPEELENNFNLRNSLWLTAGSLMQQGSDILPSWNVVAPSVRMVTSLWWFFVLIMVSSYTANLAAFLTATKMDVSISNVKELADQAKIKYGLIASGSTAAFFKNSNNSMYRRMWTTMADAKPSVFVKDNNEGVERVAKSKRNYAFLMESSGLEYAKERNCNLMKVGDLLDSKGYGIALPPNSPYRTQFNEAILYLQEHGILRKLKEEWWLKGSKNCTANQVDPSSGELTMDNVGGVFLVLFLGNFVGLAFALVEWVWHMRKIAVDEKTTPFEAFIAELKFAMNITVQKKPVKISKYSGSNSSDSVDELTTDSSMGRSGMGSLHRFDLLANKNQTMDDHD